MIWWNLFFTCVTTGMITVQHAALWSSVANNFGVVLLTSSCVGFCQYKYYASKLKTRLDTTTIQN